MFRSCTFLYRVVEHCVLCYLRNEPCSLVVCFFPRLFLVSFLSAVDLEKHSGWPNNRRVGLLIWSPGRYRTEDNMIEICTEAAERLLCTDCFADWSFWGQGGAIAPQDLLSLWLRQRPYVPLGYFGKESRWLDSRCPAVATTSCCSSLRLARCHCSSLWSHFYHLLLQLGAHPFFKSCGNSSSIFWSFLNQHLRFISHALFGRNKHVTIVKD